MVSHVVPLNMSGPFRVAVKESVFRETPLTEEDFADDLQMEFPSEEAAEEWVTEQNQAHSAMGQLTLHTAHPNDTSNADAYLVFRHTGVWVAES